VFDAYLKKDYFLCVSAEILLEYEEKFLMFWGEEVTENLMGRILAGSNTSFHSIYYNFGLVGNDPDDNKFADVYLAAGADHLVSNDAHLLQLKKLLFPPMDVVTLQEFSAMF
jgi:predicted nucleic acid-binding protein